MSIAVRWSMHEARKPYARPLGVSFVNGGDVVASLAVSGAELVYYTQFQATVLTRVGELFRQPAVEEAAQPQRSWLDHLATVLPAAPTFRVAAQSIFSEEHGRHFRFALLGTGWGWTDIDAATLVDYQEFQAAVAHQTGLLYRDETVEAIDDDARRRQEWLTAVAQVLDRPHIDDRAAEEWPWR